MTRPLMILRRSYLWASGALRRDLAGMVPPSLLLRWARRHPRVVLRIVSVLLATAGAAHLFVVMAGIRSWGPGVITGSVLVRSVGRVKSDDGVSGSPRSPSVLGGEFLRDIRSGLLYRGPHPQEGAGLVLPRSVSKAIFGWPGRPAPWVTRRID